jgi:hypothetical protein
MITLGLELGILKFLADAGGVQGFVSARISGQHDVCIDNNFSK